MLIEVHGAGFANKGAQLMLETVVSTVRDRFPTAELCIAVGADRPHREAGKLGLKYIWPTKLLEGRVGKYGPIFSMSNFASKFVPDKSLKPYGLVKRTKADALIDASGFAFSDRWGPSLMRNFATLANSYSKRNCPVVMLPQMLGPFENESNAALFREMASHCSLIYARDGQSFQLAKDCLGDNKRLHKAPDITLFNSSSEYRRDVEPEGKSDSSRNKVILVPNMRVLDMGTDWDEKSYLQMFQNVGQQAISEGYQVQILVHETLGKDALLAEKIAKELSLPSTSVFQDPNPNALKQEISTGAFLVGSRFHSLAGGLATATPVIAVGWAHKYGELLSDFGIPEFDISSKEDADRIPSLLDVLLDPTRRQDIVKGLKESKQNLAETNSKMWKDVFQLLENCI